MFFTSGIKFCRWIEHFFQKKLTLPSKMHYCGLGVLLTGNILVIAGSMFALCLVLSWIRIDARKEKKLDNDNKNETSQVIEDVKKPSFVSETERRQAIRFGIQVSLLLFSQTSVTFLFVVLTFLSYPLALGLSSLFATITLLLYKIPVYSGNITNQRRRGSENNKLRRSLKNRMFAMSRLILLWSLMGPITFSIIVVFSLENTANIQVNDVESKTSVLFYLTKWVYLVKEVHLLYENFIPSIICIILFPLYILYSIVHLLGVFV